MIFLMDGTSDALAICWISTFYKTHNT